MTEGFVPVPNVYIEMYLPVLSGSELKILLTVLYRTIGQRKESDEISVEQLQQMTGLAKSSIRAGLQRLLTRGLIVQMKAAEGGRPASYKCVTPGDND
jgi:phage replication O-like protein O